MPRKTYRKKTYRKRKQYKQTVSNAMGPLRTKLRSRFVYEERITLGSAVFDDFIFSANGVYDPNISGGGHQPRGFDQVMALYDHATVIGSKMTATFINTSSSTTAVVGILVGDNTTAFTQPSDVNEYRNSKVRCLSTLGSGAERSTIVQKVNPSKFLSISKPLSAASLKNSAGANCAEDVLYHICAYNVQGASMGTIEVLVRIEYDCILTEPKQPGQS